MSVRLLPCVKTASMPELHATMRGLYAAGYRCGDWNIEGICNRVTEIVGSGSQVHGVYMGVGNSICLMWAAHDIKDMGLTLMNSVGHLVRYMRTRPS